MQVNPVEISISGEGKRLVAPSDAFQPLSLRAMFWRPNFWAEAKWLEHLPFAFWLMEAGRPRVLVELGAGPAVSYFAFCQAVERLELETKCFAVHPWPAVGDSGTAHPGGFERIQAYNESQYAGFSRLVRSELQAAVHQFANGSIDLLHIAEGATGFTADDLEAWLPKLSERGVLLVHGTAQREGSARMHRLLDRLRPEYRSFEFAHGDGLALVTLGAEQPELLRFLCDAGQSDTARRAVHEVFFRLGRACADSHAVVREKAETRRLGEAVARQQSEVDLLQNELQQAKHTLLAKTTELEAAHQSLEAQVEERAVERGQLAEKITLLQEIRADLKSEIERLSGRLEAAQADLLVRAERAARLEQAVTARDAEVARAHSGLQQHDEVIARLQGSLETLSQQRAEHERMAARLEATQAELLVSEARVEQIRADLKQRDELLAARTAEAATRAGEMESLRERIVTLEARVAESQSERNGLVAASQKLAEEKARLEEGLARLSHQQEQTAERLAAAERMRLQADSERAAAFATLTAESNGLREQLAASARRVSEAEAELATRDRKQAERDEEIARMTGMLRDEEERVRTVQEELQRRDAQAAESGAQVRRLEAEHAAAFATLTEESKRLQEQLVVTARRLSEAETELAVRARNQAERDDEISRLTSMLREEGARVRIAHEELQRRDSQAAEAGAQVRRLEAELRTTAAAREGLERHLEDRFRELAELTSMVMREEEGAHFARARLATLQRVFGNLVDQRDIRSGSMLQKVRGRFRPAQPETALVLRSGLFDPAWYLQQYPDVANAGAEPVKHYLRFGAAENRDPSPHFSTAQYVASNRGALAAGENPLLHFISRETDNNQIAEGKVK